MTGAAPALLLVESNTTGSGRQFWCSAREQGLRPVMLAADPGRYPALAEDGVDVVLVNTADPDALRSAALGVPHVVGVTSSSDLFAVPTAWLARELGLRGDNPECVDRCRDKSRQRACLEAAGVPGARHRIACSTREATAAAVEIGLPVVVKPVDGSGSVGVRLCTSLGEVAEWSESLFGRGRPILVEEYVVGPEFSVELLGGEPVVVIAKTLGPAPSFVEMGHDLPAPLSTAQTRELCAVACSAVQALEVGTFAAHVELRWASDGPRIIEVNPRLAGGMIPRAVHLATGRDLVASVVRAAAGSAALPQGGGGARAASIRFVVPPHAGTIAGWTGAPKEAVEDLDVVMTRKVGDIVSLEGSFRDRVGYVIAGGRDLAEAQARADDALAGIAVHMA